MDETIDIEALRANVAEVLANECTHEAVIRHAESANGIMPGLWATAAELGWPALGVPERFGGLGLGVEALVPIYAELGASVAPIPFLTTMLAADCLARGENPDQRGEWLTRIAEGASATLAPPAERPGIALRASGDEITLTGQATDLIDARDAAFIILLARDEDGADYRVVVAADDGIALETQILWDHGHTVSKLTLDGVQLPAARAMKTDVEIEQALLTHADLGLAAEAVGGMEAILALTIDYLKTREQFGRAIGSFQALKHRVADHRTASVAARALLEAATRAVTSGNPAGPTEASCAKALAATNFAEVARDCVQLHGGMGFTAEQPSHLYLKRAALIGQMFGDHAAHVARATATLLKPEAA